MSTIVLNQPAPGGVASTSFFNGRLLSAEDLRAEQQSNRQARQSIGKAVGDGVAYGLMVSEIASGSPPLTPVVSIEAGLAINRNGLALRLPERIELQLARPTDPASTAQNLVFSECEPPEGGVYVTGEGAYLLVLAQAALRDGQAPSSGFGGISATCTTRSTVDTVQFRLIPLTGANLSDTAKARNRIAYQCFGASQTADASADPYGASANLPNLIEGLRPAFLTDCDVPLAVVSWSVVAGIRFVDNWCVRRRIAYPASAGPFLPERRRAEVEAMILQFDEQVRTMRQREGSTLASVVAASRFDFLPPLGMIPARGTGSPAGFDLGQFFGSRATLDVGMLDGEGLRALHSEALEHEPMQLAPPVSTPKIQLYRIFENVRAVERAESRQIAVVFASPKLPYRGVARFAYAAWDRSRFANGVI